MTLLAVSNSKKYLASGFTFVELLVVVAILIIMGVVTIPIYGNFQASAQINENSSQIIQTIRLAREQSAARINNANHGIYFMAGGYVLYQGNSYSTRQAIYDRIIVLDNSLSLTWNLIGSGEANDINFSRGMAIPNKIGTVSLQHASKGLRNIEVNNIGLAQAE